MQNLRILRVQVISSSSIEAVFTAPLSTTLITSNVSIIADASNVPNVEVLKISINNDTLTISCKPLTSFATYYILFQSVTGHPFTSLHGDAYLVQDGVANKYLITGPVEEDNPIQTYLKSYLSNNIYDSDNTNTIVGSYIGSLSLILSKALHDIKQSINENYLSFDVVDEIKTRSSGPFDRLNEEAAYEIIRVGRTSSQANAQLSYTNSAFNKDPITLQKQSTVEILTVDSSDIVGKFNINNLTLNLSNNQVTKITNLIFTLATIHPIYTYNIETLGYQITDSRYDTYYASDYVTLETNQIKLNDSILIDPLFSIHNIIRVEVAYEYKNLGRIVDATTLEVYTPLNSTREALPPIMNIFNLQHAPIVDSNNDIQTTGGITFVNPNNINQIHQAFLYEIPFRLNALPASIGQYSVDYETGTVYVYGADSTKDGTGPYPPLATYTYLYTYKSQLDYVYDTSLLEIVALPTGNLINYPGTISFYYEDVLVPDVDYKSALHIEVLNERIENRLVALNAFKTVNSPITNIFRIFNETTGEIYNLTRWNDNKVYFTYNTPPKVESIVNERTVFENIDNEMLFINTTITNFSALRVFKIFLKNSTIIAASEDGIGTSFNSSAIFSNTIAFVSEKWWNRDLSETTNIDKLLNVGEYCIDYTNGIVYCAVSATQSNDIGSISYKINSIVPTHTHLISVEDVFYRLSPLTVKNKSFTYSSFDEGSIVVDELEYSDELYLNNNNISVYQIYNKYIGTFVDSSFVSGVTNSIKFLRHVYEYEDLSYSTNPLNFEVSSTYNGTAIQVQPIVKQEFTAINYNIIDGYYVLINENIPYISSNITYSYSVIRSSDGASLTINSVVAGNPLKIKLSGILLDGDLVTVNYSFTINNISRVIVDYNKGDLFTDYTSVTDEIVVSYEYGDNVIDFREGTLAQNTNYYVSYKVGALRDALAKNFGYLINIPELTNLDVDFNRERYRDALIAALTSFLQGPTVDAIKNIAKTISHVEPLVTEYAFTNWSLGSSYLNSEEITTSGSFELLPAKFNNGVLINDISQSIQIPACSNIRLEEGTFEQWVIPQWDGIDNLANLTFEIIKDGYAIDTSEIFICVNEIHPDSNIFTINKSYGIIGEPNFNKDGVYIYYSQDITNDIYRWYVRIFDGYVSLTPSTYIIKIISDGTFYDSKSISLIKPANMTIFTGTNTLNLKIVGNGKYDEGITFVSDTDHYFLDFGKDSTTSRLSIYKDVSGYLNLRVFDKDHISYHISSDVSDWLNGEQHFIAASWKLNTSNAKDEIHLFVDGFEVPNIIKYGQRLQPYFHQKYKTINNEEIITIISKDIVGSTDLVTTTGSYSVTSSLNFSSYNINPGDLIFIDEAGFSTSGYTINTVNGQELILATAMPATMIDGRFSVNRSSFTVLSDIDVAPNMIVTTIHSFTDGYDLNGTIGDGYVISTATDFEILNVLPGYVLKVNDPLMINDLYTIVSVSGNILTLSENIPVTLVDSQFFVYSNTENEIPGMRALRPSYDISKDGYYNNILTLSDNIYKYDLVLVKTLGLNSRKVKTKYYMWSNNLEHILMTRLPAPISLDEMNITKFILSRTAIGAANSTLVAGIWQSSNLTAMPPINSQYGRTITVDVTGTNVSFTSPTVVTISGVSGGSPIVESLSFTDYGSKDFTNLYTSVTYIQVNSKPIVASRNAATVEVKEKYPITYSELGSTYPIIRYSYQVDSGTTLQYYASDAVKDGYATFSDSDVNNYLVINYPPAVAGAYKILSVSADKTILYIDSTVSSFTGGIYTILNSTSYRSGLQNGFINFEYSNSTQPYCLSSGFYELEYSSYARIKFDPLSSNLFFGSDMYMSHQANAILDQAKIFSTMLTDTRIGEISATTERTITKDYNSLTPVESDSNTLALISFDEFPFTNIADFYVRTTELKDQFSSSTVLNDYFDKSVMFLNKPMVLSNDGILDTRKEATIEFWINPIYDTGNDPNKRYYFDAYGAVTETLTSVNNTSIKLSSSISQILSVKLTTDPNIDYFAGGKIEIDTQKAISELATSVSNNSVTVLNEILQVISIKIVGDLTDTDYFVDGTIATNGKTIYLGKLLPASTLPLIVLYQSTNNNNKTINTQIIRLNKKLPYQKSLVDVTYLPKGLQGDRISLYKDEDGYMNFEINASNVTHTLSAPIRWSKDTWHRVKASYKMNSINSDEMYLFLDGYSNNSTLDGYDGYDGYNLTMNITFKDIINQIVIGGDYRQNNPIYSLIDNLRISNILRPIYAPYGEPIDVNYTSNVNSAFPVTSDLYTTYLMNFDESIIKSSDFINLKDKDTGNFDFSLNVLDSFDIVGSSDKVKQILEKLIKMLKPANSKAYIQYT